jgi:hypothetical protein
LPAFPSADNAGWMGSYGIFALTECAGSSGK